jgi:N-acetylglucosamine kinase-like BadF-type ATPase
MILIADSGSTKCSWALCDTNGKLIQEISTIGFNPYFIDDKSILNHLENSDLNNWKDKISHVFFYGAGCSSKAKNKIIETPFIGFFKNATVNISHDLDAACFAMYDGNPGITCILGTGSNSCYYDGKEIYEHAPSLGFIMGDDASGNYFGKKILSLYFNGKMDQELKEKFESSFESNIDVINKNVYNTNRANVFLAQYFPFITVTRDHPIIQKLIKDTLDEFIDQHVKCFSKSESVSINFIGSVAFFLSDEIEEATKRHGLKKGRILKNPIGRLIEYHFEKINQRI